MLFFLFPLRNNCNKTIDSRVIFFFDFHRVKKSEVDERRIVVRS